MIDHKKSTLLLQSNDTGSVGKTPLDQRSRPLSPKIGIESHEKIPKVEHPKLLFNLKITDLTRSDNPFVFYENQEVDKDGYLLFSSPKTAEDKVHVSITEFTRRKPVPKASLFKSHNNM